MLRTLTITVLGALAGIALGGALAGSLGAALGAMLGAVSASSWRTAVESFARGPSASEALTEQHRVMCLPKGEVADCAVVRDAHTGAWLDVRSCSLCERPDHVRCRKRCLLLLEDAEPASAKRMARAAYERARDAIPG